MKVGKKLESNELQRAIDVLIGVPILGKQEIGYGFIVNFSRGSFVRGEGYLQAWILLR